MPKYHISCDCASYDWTRRKPRSGLFMRCRGCHKILGPMQVSMYRETKKAPARIMVVGDIHGDFLFLNKLIKEKKPDLLISCGDFGWWPKCHDTEGMISSPTTSRTWKLFGAIENGDCKILFAPGNHEDWDALDKIEASGNTEVMPNIFYMPRGSVYTLEDGRNILFFGGAESIDKARRTQGVSWFPQEVATQKDIFLLDKIKHKIDIVVSHTCPTLFSQMDAEFPEKMKDPTRRILDYILTTFKPELWVFGHYHTFLEGNSMECRFTCLDMFREYCCWKWLENVSPNKLTIV